MRRLFPVRSRASMYHLFFHQVVTNAKERPRVTFFLCALGRPCATSFFEQVVTSTTECPCVTSFLRARGRPCAIPPAWNQPPGL